MEVYIPYDCWKLILNYLRQDLENECKNSSYYYYKPLNALDVWLLILRSTSHNIQQAIEKYQHEHALIFGFHQGAVTHYLSAKGYLSCLKYFVMDLKYYIGKGAADEAAAGGHYECLKFIGEVNPKITWKYDSAQQAANGGNLLCLEYCHNRGAHISLPEIQTAASLGNLEMVKYIRPHVDPSCANYYTSFAAYKGHLNILQYAVESGDGLAENVCQRAVEGDHYDCLVYAHQNGGNIDENCIHVALKFGAIRCAMYLLEHTKITPGSSVVFGDYARGGPVMNVDLLKMLHNQGVIWGAYTCTTAILRGSVECLRFVLETGASKSDYALYRQAISNKKDWFDYFKVLEEHNVPHDPKEYIDCSYTGNLECMVYLYETVRLPWPEYMSSSLVLHKNFKCLEYAYEHGCPWSEDTCRNAVERSDADLKFLKYAHEHGAPWDERVTFLAASRGRLEMLKYAHENGCGWNQKTIREASFRGHKRCVEYMQQEGLRLINT